MVLLCETLLKTCLSVRFFGTYAGCASGVVLSNKSYLQLHSIAFEHMLTPIAAYNPGIKVFEVYHCADKQKWTAKLTSQSLIRSTKWGERKFIILVFEDTWNLRLKDTDTFYSRVTLLALLKYKPLHHTCILCQHQRHLSGAITIPKEPSLPCRLQSHHVVPQYMRTLDKKSS